MWRMTEMTKLGELPSLFIIIAIKIWVFIWTSMSRAANSFLSVFIDICNGNWKILFTQYLFYTYKNFL